MAVLRDIVARFRIGFNKKGVKEAGKAVDTLKTRLGSLNTVAAAAALGTVAFGAFKLIEAASDANETLNVLNASFEHNTQEVLNWSEEFAGAAGRSKFAMRQMSGELGAVLNPLMGRNADAAAEMSMGLSELAVDLGSFFNSTDDDALGALRSAITGEAEAIKRFGVVMNTATLEAFAMSEGITKSFNAMSNAEKTALRYNFILDQTKLSQGDAAKTSQGWANATKGAAAAVMDLATDAGAVLLPFAEKAVNGFRSLINTFKDMVAGSEFIKAALIVVGVVAAIVASAVIVAWWPVILPFIKLAAIMAIAALVLDDFLTFMKGGESVIGRFIELVAGPGSAAEAAQFLQETWDALIFFMTQIALPKFLEFGGFLKDVFIAIFQGAAEMAKNVIGFVGDIILTFDNMGAHIRKVLDLIIPPIDKFISLVGGALTTAANFAKDIVGFEDVTTAKATINGVVQESKPTVARSGRARANRGGVTNTITINAPGATARDATTIAAATGGSVRRATGAALTQSGG